jgi:hypothetical protein
MSVAKALSHPDGFEWLTSRETTGLADLREVPGNNSLKILGSQPEGQKSCSNLLSI